MDRIDSLIVKMLAVLVFLMTTTMSSLAAEPAKDTIKEGKQLTLKFCQACHQYEGTEQAGTVAPPLLGMKGRFPDRTKLYNIIYDPQVALRPHTMMPPFGRNHLLEKEQIEKVIDFLYTL
ncbi:MAG: sulfur oxidation c-type cytochrome SoxX [Gammaproteobacteria bacterium]|jgi:sulfur-oxidizing protein SoxX